MPSSARPFSLRAVAVAAAVLSLSLVSACSDAPTAVQQAPSRPANAMVAAPNAYAVPSTGSMLSCPASATESASAVIGPRGGSVGVGGSALIVPPGAVPHATEFTFVVPASPYVQVEVHAAGVEHYAFKRPVAITVSYARCAPSALPASPFGAWWIDPATREQLGVMAGIDDRRHERLTFITDHLSGFLVAY